MFIAHTKIFFKHCSLFMLGLLLPLQLLCAENQQAGLSLKTNLVLGGTVLAVGYGIKKSRQYYRARKFEKMCRISIITEGNPEQYYSGDILVAEDMISKEPKLLTLYTQFPCNTLPNPFSDVIGYDFDTTQLLLKQEGAVALINTVFTYSPHQSKHKHMNHHRGGDTTALILMLERVCKRFYCFRDLPLDVEAKYWTQLAIDTIMPMCSKRILDWPDDENRRGIYYAIRFRDKRLLESFINHGADVTTQNGSPLGAYRTPLGVAKHTGFSEGSQILREACRKQYLEQNGPLLLEAIGAHVSTSQDVSQIIVEYSMPEFQ